MDNYYQPLEKAELVRSGRDVTILCYSRMRYVVMQAVQQLELQGYDPEVHPVRAPLPGLKLLVLAVLPSSQNRSSMFPG